MDDLSFSIFIGFGLAFASCVYYRLLTDSYENEKTEGYETNSESDSDEEASDSDEGASVSESDSDEYLESDLPESEISSISNFDELKQIIADLREICETLQTVSTELSNSKSNPSPNSNSNVPISYNQSRFTTAGISSLPSQAPSTSFLPTTRSGGYLTNNDIAHKPKIVRRSDEEERSLIEKFQNFVGMNYNEVTYTARNNQGFSTEEQPAQKFKFKIVLANNVKVFEAYSADNVYNPNVIGVAVDDAYYEYEKQTPSNSAVITQIVNIGGDLHAPSTTPPNKLTEEEVEEFLRI